MEWVNLLRTPEKKSSKPRLNSSDGGGSWRAERVRVLENTPQAKVGVKKSKRSEVQVLRSQVASLAREKRDLALNVSTREAPSVDRIRATAFSLFSSIRTYSPFFLFGSVLLFSITRTNKHVHVLCTPTCVT